MEETEKANAALGELLDLFQEDDDEQQQTTEKKMEDVENEAMRKEKCAVNSKMEANLKHKRSDPDNVKKKTSRCLVPINFECSGINKENSSRTGKAARSNSLLHTGDTSSSEDELERNHEHPSGLSASGRNIKRQLKCAAKNKSFSQGDTSQRKKLQKNAQRVAEIVESSSKDAYSVYDAFFEIRVRNPLISSTAFQSFCDGLQKVRLNQLKIYASKIDNWISLAVIVGKTGCQKSANGHDYMIWKVADLKNPQDAAVKILVFGDCIKKFWKLQLGSVVALVTPCFADGNNKEVTLKLTKSAQLLEVGFCPDFGHCKAVKKDGALCNNVVNLSQCERCIYHVQRAARKFTANRGSFHVAASKSNKVQRSNSFAGDVLTGPRRAATIPTNTLTINESRKNVKQLCSERSKSLKISHDKMASSEASTEKKVGTICGSGNLSQEHGKIKNGLPLEEKASKSMKEFLQKQHENKNSKQTPVLGKGLNFGSVLLASPQRTFSKLNALENAKQKAIAIIRNKGGLEKADPNLLNGKPRKRRSLLDPVEREGKSKMQKSEAKSDEMNDFENRGEIVSRTGAYTNDQIAALLMKKSSHENDLRREDAKREECYFNAMEQNEKLETYLTSTMEVKNCNVVTCCQCSYTSHKQSDLCKQMGHAVVHHKVSKRFFQCKQCHRRTVSYERMPTAPCIHCGSSNFRRVAMKDERKVKLAQENLLIRGEERKFVNS